jgi:hypothetical protein
MSDNGRSEARGGRNRSRSPRRDRAPRRDTRYRSRSPFRRDEREGGRGGDRGRNDRDRDERRPDFRGREPPKGPRGGGAGGPRRDVKPVRAESPVEAPDVEMKEEKQKPEGMDDETWEMAKVMGVRWVQVDEEHKGAWECEELWRATRQADGGPTVHEPTGRIQQAAFAGEGVRGRGVAGLFIFWNGVWDAPQLYTRIALVLGLHLTDHYTIGVERGTRYTAYMLGRLQPYRKQATQALGCSASRTARCGAINSGARSIWVHDLSLHH